MLEDLSFGKLLIILLVVMVLFGAKKIPDLAQGLGKGIREFKKALKDEDASPENQEKKTENKQVQ
ncbi:MAG: twin-arginine translocase TatA/TatE family subunit [Bacteroidetes bacterium]|nr:twin-arginine translocase TatA/TatE family subunit [Bacteroidota bacterium]